MPLLVAVVPPEWHMWGYNHPKFSARFACSNICTPTDLLPTVIGHRLSMLSTRSTCRRFKGIAFDWQAYRSDVTPANTPERITHNHATSKFPRVRNGSTLRLRHTLQHPFRFPSLHCSLDTMWLLSYGTLNSLIRFQKGRHESGQRREWEILNIKKMTT